MSVQWNAILEGNTLYAVILVEVGNTGDDPDVVETQISSLEKVLDDSLNGLNWRLEDVISNPDL